MISFEVEDYPGPDDDPILMPGGINSGDVLAPGESIPLPAPSSFGFSNKL
jgi:hypothetical protein